MGKKIASILAGIALLAAWSKFDDWRSGGKTVSSAQQGIPAKVWEGGGHKVTYEVSGVGPMRVSAWFSGRGAPGGEEKRSLETWEKIDAAKTFEIDAPVNSGASFDLTEESPKIGDAISITVSVDGKKVCSDAQKLDKPLENGYAFGVQCEVDNFGAPPQAAEPAEPAEPSAE